MNKQYIDFVPVSRVKKAPKTTVISVTSTTVVAPRRAEDELAAIKSQKVGGAKVVQQTITERKTEVVTETAKIVPDARKMAAESKKAEMKIPQVNFINQEKVIKRPLSKNVYVKKEEVEEKPEEANEPVMIVDNEKKSKAGAVIAIIIAIILGAAAGTAVFFLLPK